MKTNSIQGLLFCVLSLFAIQNVYAEEPPFIGGEYWEVTGIKISDGAGLKYSTWLAGEWRKNSDYAKSQGWLIDAKVISNVHPRMDEPDLYLVRVFENMASVAENEKRRTTYMAWAKKSMEKMESESGNRAEFRTIMSTSLLQEMKYRD
ncbi:MULTISPECIES: hypothetical protein [Shewanella]|uniref:Uncharacterized protein n=1 Tax=Shewanella psychromarinicola TaxID=2487742 RepID=A0A3N4E0Q8_9GAMM|nr:hypothetical protein [Shewanella psychromarinicola]AZG36070.1 hypothetical protein EGC80_15090 [Shewanella psychromarinicola]MCL1080439.1 hypothetical protein [Shewanella psychromarinicola]RPA31759.1 hypothetical protein EGC77_12575 [Shewanella psychromarinicola]